MLLFWDHGCGPSRDHPANILVTRILLKPKLEKHNRANIYIELPNETKRNGTTREDVTEIAEKWNEWYYRSVMRSRMIDDLCIWSKWNVDRLEKAFCSVCEQSRFANVVEMCNLKINDQGELPLCSLITSRPCSIKIYKNIASYFGI